MNAAKSFAAKSRFSLLAAMIIVVGLVGCTGTPAPTSTATAIAASATHTPSPTGAPTPNATGDSGLTLIWWTPEFVSPQAAQPAGPLLAAQIATFEATQAGKVRVQSILKARYGKGGVLDFLRTAQPVAPNILPDVVAMDVTELEAAAAAGLLQPLEPLLDENLIAVLYPFARRAGTFDGRLLAVQFISDVDHVVYLPERIKVPPTTWADLLNGKLPYLFPAGSPQPGSAGSPSESAQRAIISQYRSASAVPVLAGRELALEPDPLLQLFTFYKIGSETGILPPGAADLPDVEAVWNIFTQNRTPMAYVNARRYLAERDTLKFSGFAAAPGWSGPAQPIASGWALAIVTTDPARQRAAAALIAYLLAADNAGAWTRAAGWLPTSAEALAAWGENPYFDFLNEQLTDATSYPAGADYPQIAARLQKAASAVLKGESGPDEAVEAAINPPK